LRNYLMRVCTSCKWINESRQSQKSVMKKEHEKILITISITSILLSCRMSLHSKYLNAFTLFYCRILRDFLSLLFYPTIFFFFFTKINQRYYSSIWIKFFFPAIARTFWVRLACRKRWTKEKLSSGFLV